MQPHLSNPPLTGWKDKRWLWLWSPAVPVVFGSSLLAFAWSGHWAWLLYAPVFIHLVLPVLDTLFGEDFSNPPESAVAQLEQDGFYRALVWAYASSVGGHRWVRGWPPRTTFLVRLGGAGGVGGLVQRHWHWHGARAGPKRSIRPLAVQTGAGSQPVRALLSGIQPWPPPLRPRPDPASSRMGESFWAFLPRTVLGSLRSAWHIERERLAKQGKSALSNYNRRLGADGGAVWRLVGWLGWLVLVFLKARRVCRVYAGGGEPCGALRPAAPARRSAPRALRAEHSWNSNHIVGNILLYHLQRHSTTRPPRRRYQALRHLARHRSCAATPAW